MKSNIGLIVNKVYERLRPWHAIEWLWASGDGNVWFVKIGGVAMYVHLQKSGQFEVMECEPYQGGLMPFRKDGNFAWRIEQLLNGAVRDDVGNLRQPSQERGPSPMAKVSAQVAEDMAICQMIIDKFVSSTIAAPVVLDASPETIEKMTAMLREQDQGPLMSMPFRKLFAPYEPMIHPVKKPRPKWLPEGARILGDDEVITEGDRYWDGFELIRVVHSPGLRVADAKQRWSYKWQWCRREDATTEVAPEVKPQPEAWRHLGPDEVIQEGDKLSAKSNPDSLCPLHPGYIDVFGPFIGEVAGKRSEFHFARKIATPEVTPQEPQQDTQQVCGDPNDGWKPKVGDWVRVTKPASHVPGAKCRWIPRMDHLDGAVVQLIRFEAGGFVFSTTGGEEEKFWSLEPSWLSKWEPKVGDWVQVKKPSVPSPPNNWSWVDRMDHLDGAIVKLVKEDTRFFKYGFRFTVDGGEEQRFTLIPEWLSKWEPKPGDWVKVTKPEKIGARREPMWVEPDMDCIDGAVVQLETSRMSRFPFACGVGDCFWYLDLDWLSPAEPPVLPSKEPASAEPSIEIPVVVNESLPEGVFALTSPGGEAIVVSKPAESVEYITPTDEHRGMMVEVRDDDDEEWVMALLLAVLPESICFPFVCEDQDEKDRFTGWKQARVKVAAKPEPKLMFKGEEYRLATEADVGRTVLCSDISFEMAVSSWPSINKLVRFDPRRTRPYELSLSDGYRWKYAWVKVSSDGGGA